ncbi:DNA-binding protein [Brucellaceae bacterium VT-16-1752]|nr:DNA-binding protein [Brucellaceae bacterium VT-16-1752]
MTHEREDADLLYGAAAIASFLGIPKRAAQHQVKIGRIPTFRLGANICATKTSLRTWLTKKEAEMRGGVSHE